MLIASVAAAAPSQLGPTGIVATPTADVVGNKTYDVALDYAKWDVSGDNFKSMPVRLLAGVTDKVEVGIGYTKWKNFSELKVTPVNVKAVVVPESETAPAVAVGAAYGKLKETGFAAIKVTTLYAVATKTLSKPADEYDEGGMKGTVRGSLGVMYNKYKDSIVDDNATEPFISLEYLTADGKTTLAVEYKTSEGLSFVPDDALMSFVARHMFTPNVWGQVGLTNAWYTIPNPGDGDKEWFIGVGYRWAPPAEEEWYY
jgi:hypothetical protein